MEGKRTFCCFQCTNISSEFVDSLDIFIFLYTIKDYPATSLEIDDTVLEGHGPYSDASIHGIVGKVKVPNSPCIYTSTLFLQGRDDLDGFDLRGPRNSSCRKYGTKGIKSTTLLVPRNAKKKFNTFTGTILLSVSLKLEKLCE
jgi:hypothetical protein